MIYATHLNPSTHAFTITFHPVTAILAPTNNKLPTVTHAAAKIHVASKCKFPTLAPRIAPAIGVPANTPKLMHANPIPIRVPIRARFFVKLTKMLGGNDTNVPLKKP